MKNFFIYIQITMGAILFSIGVELILIPNNISDSGVAGVSIMMNYVTGIKVWIPFLLMNLIILLFTAKSIGKQFVGRTIYANLITSISLNFLHGKEQITHSELLTILYGGISVGIGIALVIKNSAAIDGTEMIAIWVNKKFHLPISTFLMFVNAFVYTAVIFVFTLEKALLSIATFYIITKSIDFILDGTNKAKSIMIITNNPHKIGELLMNELELPITYITGEGGYTGEERRIIYCIVDRIVYPRLKELVLKNDPTAIIEASIVTETTGVNKANYFDMFKSST